jgi:hypothetical protein
LNILKRLFGPPDKPTFAKTLMRAIRQTGTAKSIEFDSREFKLTLNGEQILFLSNAYKEYCQSPRRARATLLRKYAALGDRVDTERVEAIRDRILPRIQSRYYHEAVRLTVLKSDSDQTGQLPFRRFTQYLNLDLVVDFPDKIALITGAKLKAWNTSFDELLPLAKENLWKRSNESFQMIQPGLYVSPWQDALDTGRMFLHDLIWQLSVKGPHVAVIPNRVSLFVCGADDEGGLLRLAEVTEAARQTDRFVCTVLHKLEGSHWIPWLPPTNSPAFAPWHRLAMLSIATDYSEQTEALNAVTEQRKWDVFVGKFEILRLPSGELRSWTTWADGVTDALMPETDLIAFAGVDREGEIRKLGWGQISQVKAVAGELMEKTDDWPTRYHLTGFPSEDQIQKMGLSSAPQ